MSLENLYLVEILEWGWSFYWMELLWNFALVDVGILF
jgi:hypothetical protein